MPITSANRLSTAQNFFLEAVQSTNLRAEDRIIDLLKIECNKQPLACLSACSRTSLVELVDMMVRLGARVAVVEPAAMGLLRAAVYSFAPTTQFKAEHAIFPWHETVNRDGSCWFSAPLLACV